MTKWRASLYVLSGAACYGTLATMTKLSFAQGFTPAEITSSHVLFGWLMLWLCVLPIVRKMRKIPWQTVMIVVAAGSIWGVTEMCYTVSLHKIPASLAVICLFQFTWMSQLVYMIQQRTWISGRRWLSLASVLFGTYWASGFNAFHLSQIDWFGIVLGLCSAISYTGSLFVSGTVGKHLNPLLRSAFMVTGQMILIFFIFPPTFLFTDALARGLWIWAGLIGFFGIVVTTITYNKGIPYIGTGLAGILGSIELPIVLLLATFILQEQVTAWQWMGTCFIVLGIVIAETGTSNQFVRKNFDLKKWLKTENFGTLWTNNR